MVDDVKIAVKEDNQYISMEELVEWYRLQNEIIEKVKEIYGGEK